MKAYTPEQIQQMEDWLISGDLHDLNLAIATLRAGQEIEQVAWRGVSRSGGLTCECRYKENAEAFAKQVKGHAEPLYAIKPSKD